MDKYVQAIKLIIREQQNIVGELVAMGQARKVSEIKINGLADIQIEGEPKNALQNLVVQYSQLFGPASIEVCKEAITKSSSPLSKEELPEILL